eukprot:364484-Chlamydomonas_euryale.AAC.2
MPFDFDRLKRRNEPDAEVVGTARQLQLLDVLLFTYVLEVDAARGAAGTGGSSRAPLVAPAPCGYIDAAGIGQRPFPAATLSPDEFYQQQLGHRSGGELRGMDDPTGVPGAAESDAAEGSAAFLEAAAGGSVHPADGSAEQQEQEHGDAEAAQHAVLMEAMAAARSAQQQQERLLRRRTRRVLRR